MTLLTVGSLFSGIGGIDLGLARAGFEIKWQVELDAYCRRVLARHWPEAKRYDDIRTINPDELERVDMLAGGFPCQPTSIAGRRRGRDDQRWLWPEFARIIRALRPRFVFVENTPGLLIREFGDVLGDLAASGYDAEWDCIPAAAFGAPHLRYRLFIIAYPNGNGCEGRELEQEFESKRESAPEFGAHSEIITDINSAGRAQQRFAFANATPPATAECGGWWATEPGVVRMVHGVSNRAHRIRGLGNAVVPQVAEYVGHRVLEMAQS